MNLCKGIKQFELPSQRNLTILGQDFFHVLNNQKMNYQEEQEQELEILRSIYDEDEFEGTCTY
jgi:hypothetical protein